MEKTVPVSDKIIIYDGDKQYTVHRTDDTVSVESNAWLGDSLRVTLAVQREIVANSQIGDTSIDGYRYEWFGSANNKVLTVTKLASMGANRKNVYTFQHATWNTFITFMRQSLDHTD